MNKTKLVFLFSRLMFIVLISLGIMGNLTLISFGFDNFGRCFREMGFCYVIFGMKIGIQFWDKIEKCIDIIERVNKNQRDVCYFALGMSIAENFHHAGVDFTTLVNSIGSEGRYAFYYGYLLGIGASTYNKSEEQVLNARNQLSPKYWRYFYEGRGFKTAVERRLPLGIESCINLIEENTENKKYNFWYFEGLGKEMGISFTVSNITKSFQEISRVNEKYREYIYKGFGWGLAIRINSKNISYRMKEIRYIPASYIGSVYRGFGEGLYLKYRYDINKALEILNKVEPKYRAYVYRGLGYETGIEYGYDADGCKDIIGKIDEEYKIYFLEGLKGSVGLSFKG